MSPRTPSDSAPVQPELDAAADGSDAESFEAAYARLEAVAQQLEAGGLTLEQSVALYEEGMRLAERCQALLGDVEQRIEILRQRANGD